MFGCQYWTCEKSVMLFRAILICLMWISLEKPRKCLWPSLLRKKNNAKCCSVVVQCNTHVQRNGTQFKCQEKCVRNGSRLARLLGIVTIHLGVRSPYGQRYRSKQTRDDGTCHIFTLGQAWLGLLSMLKSALNQRHWIQWEKVSTRSTSKQMLLL